MNELVNDNKSSTELSIVKNKEIKMYPVKISPSVREESVRRITEDGEKVIVVAKELRVARSTVNNWVGNYKKELKDGLEKQSLKKMSELLKEENRRHIEEIKRLNMKSEVQKEMLNDMQIKMIKDGLRSS